jgi:hypothetical protein
MERHAIIGLYVVLTVAVIVSVDFLVFRREFWESRPRRYQVAQTRPQAQSSCRPLSGRQITIAQAGLRVLGLTGLKGQDQTGRETLKVKLKAWLFNPTMEKTLAKLATIEASAGSAGGRKIGSLSETCRHYSQSGRMRGNGGGVPDQPGCFRSRVSAAS